MILNIENTYKKVFTTIEKSPNKFKIIIIIDYIQQKQ